jgi:hypothetical protein
MDVTKRNDLQKELNSLMPDYLRVKEVFEQKQAAYWNKSKEYSNLLLKITTAFDDVRSQLLAKAGVEREWTVCVVETQSRSGSVIVKATTEAEALEAAEDEPCDMGFYDGDSKYEYSDAEVSDDSDIDDENEQYEELTGIAIGDTSELREAQAKMDAAILEIEPLKLEMESAEGAHNVWRKQLDELAKPIRHIENQIRLIDGTCVECGKTFQLPESLLQHIAGKHAAKAIA